MAHTTQQVNDNHEAAFQNRDRARLMADYADGAVCYYEIMLLLFGFFE